MKVYVLLTGTALPGKFREARQAVLASVKYLNANKSYVGVYDAVRPHAGPNSQVAWMCRYESLADYEKDAERRAKDPGWAEVFGQVAQTLDADNIVTAQILNVIE